MAKTETIRARIEPEVKAAAEAVLKEMGMSPSDAIGLFYRQVAWQQGIPFIMKIPNAETRAAMEEVERDKQTPFLKQYDSVKALFDEYRE